MSKQVAKGKVELLAEAIENLAIGVSACGLEKVDESKPRSRMVQDFVEAARAEVRLRLQEFLRPMLTLVEGGARQPYHADVPDSERVRCGDCGRHFICADTNCAHWHAAVRAHMAKTREEAKAESKGEECPACHANCQFGSCRERECPMRATGPPEAA